MCLLFEITCCIVNIRFSLMTFISWKVDIFDFRHIDLFGNVMFYVVFGQMFMPKCAYRPWTHFLLFVQNKNDYVTSQVLVCRGSSLSVLCKLINVRSLYQLFSLELAVIAMPCHCVPPAPPPPPTTKK